MANKKKNVNVEEKNKKEKVVKKTEEKSKKDLKKEKEFEKLVAEEEIEEVVEDFDEDYDDEDDNEVIIVKEKKHNEGKCACGDDCNCGCNCNNETMVLKFLIGVSICVSVLTLLISFIVLNKVNNINSYYSDDKVVELDNDNTDSTSADYDVSMFKSIDADEFIDMFDKDDDKIRFVYTGRETCSYCVAFLPALQQSIEDYDYTLYYLDTTGVTEDAYNEIVEFDSDLEESFMSTPMVYAIKNGEVVDYNNGYTEYSTYVEFLEDNKVKEK